MNDYANKTNINRTGGVSNISSLIPTEARDVEPTKLTYTSVFVEKTKFELSDVDKVNILNNFISNITENLIELDRETSEEVFDNPWRFTFDV